ncbi:MAG: DNA polymerase III subunit delta [Actinomycetota bacterium]
MAKAVVKEEWPLYFVKGDDEILVSQELRRLIHELIGDGDPSLCLEEHELGFEKMQDREMALGAMLDAARTAPFLVPRRYVVATGLGKLTADEARPLVEILNDPVPGVIVVMASVGGRTAPGITKAVEAHGKVINAAVGKDKKSWVVDHLASAPLKIDAKAGQLIIEHLGEDLSRLEGLLEMLISTYGEGSVISTAQVEPFLGHQGSIPTWDLTDPIDAGLIPEALIALHRLLNSSGPYRVFPALHAHFTDMLALDGSGANSGTDAQQILGMRGHPFPAEKKLKQARRLGGERIARGVQLCAEAELAMRGGSDLEDAVVLEVLVARLAQLAGGRRPATARG